jgi:hypothetical protein
MAWQDRFRALGEELIAGTISTGEYRERLDGILAEAERRERVHIPTSAALEAPTGEMTQIVGARDDTTPLGVGKRLE